MKSRSSQQNRFLRIITGPIRALCKARDFYVRSMTEYADRMNYGNVMAVPGTSQVSGLPKSFSVGSGRSYNSEDFQELVRAASARMSGERIDLDSYIKQQMKMRAGSAAAGSGPQAMPPRSSSVVMGRIDEDKPCCYFGEDVVMRSKNEIKYPRSKSHAATTRKLSAF
ncbi:hypothetical protein CDL12_15788 [Handroanthus impetiginosus]|uniref:Uncharacterized protein n=1 Tax=Handroanthus impetiginosus TaxID=429701 RepID=A0A2G9H277_9LAMI|nr:hypothetical protein CDL12_15788 [Handroanthus impetiginosus]